MSVVAKYWIIFVLALFKKLKKAISPKYTSVKSSLQLFLDQTHFVDSSYIYLTTV